MRVLNVFVVGQTKDRRWFGGKVADWFAGNFSLTMRLSFGNVRWKLLWSCDGFQIDVSLNMISVWKIYIWIINEKFFVVCLNGSWFWWIWKVWIVKKTYTIMTMRMFCNECVQSEYQSKRSRKIYNYHRLFCNVRFWNASKKTCSIIYEKIDFKIYMKYSFNLLKIKIKSEI